MSSLCLSRVCVCVSRVRLIVGACVLACVCLLMSLRILLGNVCVYFDLILSFREFVFVFYFS